MERQLTRWRGPWEEQARKRPAESSGEGMAPPENVRGRQKAAMGEGAAPPGLVLGEHEQGFSGGGTGLGRGRKDVPQSSLWAP